jgi:site-specific DNA recombinase
LQVGGIIHLDGRDGSLELEQRLFKNERWRCEEQDSDVLTIAWAPPSPYRRREIIQGTSAGSSTARPLPNSAHLVLVKALRKAHRWLDELLTEPKQTIESIAARESKSERSIRMTLSLAFLSPDIVKAAMDGSLPRGFGLTRLIDPPIADVDNGVTCPRAL